MAAPTFNAQRSIDVFTPPVGLITYPGLRPVARITRDREPLKPDLTVAEKEHETDPPTDTETDTETATILTALGRRHRLTRPIFNISLKKINPINELKKSMAHQTLIFRIFMRPLVGGLKRIQTIVLRRFRAGGPICIAL